MKISAVISTKTIREARVVESARCHQGTMSQDSVPTAEAASEGPSVEVMRSFGHWLEPHGGGGPKKVTLFTPGDTIAEDAGLAVI